MALAALFHAVSELLPDSVKNAIPDPSGVFSSLLKPVNFSSDPRYANFSDIPEWARQPLRESGIPGWVNVVIALAAIIPILYLLLRDTKAKVFLKPTEFQDLPLDHIEVVSHNVRRFRFALPDKKMVIGLPIGSHITIAAKDTEGKDVMRPYTPVTDDNSKGYVDFVIKDIEGKECMRPCTPITDDNSKDYIDYVIKLYPQGKMSQCMDRLSVGDTLRFKGPRGRFKYQPKMKKAIGMIAGGSGITPMFQVAQGILRNPLDATKVFLMYANVTEEDILLRKELDAWARDHRARFKVYYVLNKPPAEWKGGVGYVSKEMVHEHLPLPNEEVITLRCGPPPMNRAVEAILDDSGFTKEMQFEF